MAHEDLRVEFHKCAVEGSWWEPVGRPEIESGWIREVVISGQIPGTGQPVHTRGVRIRGVVLDGQIDLAHADLVVPMLLDDIVASEQIVLEQASGSSISITNSRLAGIFARQLRLVHSLDLSGTSSDVSINLTQASIGGQLNCTGVTLSLPGGHALVAAGVRVAGSVVLGGGFAAEGIVSLLSSSIGDQLICAGGTFLNKGGTALILDSAEVSDVFFSAGFKAEGEVRLVGASINGELNCEGGTFTNKGGLALFGDAVHVTGNALLSAGFKAEGEVRLLGATMKSLNCEGGIFTNKGGYALNLDKAKIGSVFLRNGFKAEGKVWLAAVAIDGQLDCTDGTFSAPDEIGLNMQGTAIGGSFLWQPRELVGTTGVDLTAASVSLLVDDVALWPQPGRMRLDRFAYGGFAPGSASDAATRIEWIESTGEFHSQPYEQLAAVFRSMGKTVEARDVGIAKEKARSGTLTGWRRFWHKTWGVFTAYGYRPGKALSIFAAILLFAGLFFSWAGSSGVMEPTDLAEEALATVCTEKYPCYEPFIYAADVIIPIVDLDQRDAWAPNVASGGTDVGYWPWAVGGSTVRWIAVLLVAAGWALTAALIASASQTISRG